MSRINKIKESLNNSCKYLISIQNQNGSWTDPEAPEISRDSLYKQPVVTTSQAMRALIFNIKPEYIQDQIKDEREQEFFDNPIANRVLDMMEKNEEGQNTVIQVKDGKLDINTGKKKKNNNS